MRREFLNAGGFLRGLRFVLVAVVVLLFSLIIYGFYGEVLRELRSLNAADSDNAQWTLSQVEVEYLMLQRVLEQADHDDPAALAEIRKRFDIFYSRVATIETGAPYARLHLNFDFEHHLVNVKDFLDEVTPLIDAEDEFLGSAVSALATETEGLRADVRAMALNGLEQFAAIADERRAGVARTLRHMVLATVSLVIVLLCLISILYKMNRLSTVRAGEQRRMSGQLRAIIGSSLDAVVVADDSGTVRVFNGAAERVFGYSETEAVGQRLSDLIIPEKYTAAHDAGLKRFVETREKRVVGAGRVELEGKRKSGEVFPVELSIDMAENEDETIFVSYLRDITDRRLAEQELVETRDRALAGEKAKAEFLAMMSHEMRTPLNGLLGTLTLLRETSLTERQATFLDNMDASGQLLLHHVNDVLDISKFEAGRIQIENTPFDLDELLSGIVAGQSSVAASHGNTLSYAWVSDIPGEVRGDPVRLRQVMLNLVNNALKFTQSGDVWVEAEKIGSGRRPMFEFRVTDNGIGIAEADMERIFNDFETLDRSYGRMAGGTGLGLGIARRLVEAMGGEIGAESEEGEGSMFWVRVPLEITAKNIVSPDKPTNDVPRNKLDILIVEDNEINRQVLEAMLLRDGHSVAQAVNGKEGVEAAAAKAFDAILMDVSMPVMDGVSATRAIREGNGPCHDVPILAVTAHAMPGDRETFRAAGMSGLVTKPIVRDELRDNLERIGNRAGRMANPGGAQDDDVDEAFTPESLHELAQALGAERAEKLLNDFIREMDAGVALLADGKDNGVELSELVSAVHKMAGSCGTFGAERLRIALSDVETLAKSGDAAGARSRIGEIPGLWRKDRTYFEQQRTDA
ncbi:hybrid sensor histidine kinase/response regulator [Tropicimonas marinistellae]|uniref:hybrid sensor histidine kinase/response regulator n=1 Tax=Tropicimonas marinistellae TaxID=1739787 RepID=UPI00082C3FE7|nr:ATP-binding protein [Tropicimonas marinistellae]